MKKITPEPLKLTFDCLPCAIGSLIKLFHNGFIPAEKQEATMRSLLKFLSEINFNQSPPVMGQKMHRIIRQLLNDPDPYRAIKKKYNSVLLEYYPKFKEKVARAQDPFNLALRLAIAGNIIDFGPNNSFDIDHTFSKAESVKFAIDHSSELKAALKTADTLLYLGDNAGEIVLDRIFLETIQHPKVYFAVRGTPVINDATFEDAQMVGIDKIARIISDENDAPGTILKDTSVEFQNLFNNADLIISKGQGNYESLCDCKGNIFFLLMAKCDHVAQHLGVNKGDFIVK